VTAADTVAAGRRPRAAAVIATVGTLLAVLLAVLPRSLGLATAGPAAYASGTFAADRAGLRWSGQAPPPVLAGSAATPGARKRGVPFNGTAAVGALFTQTSGHLGRHFCTASVVHSKKGNLLITAAHCLLGRSLKPAGRVVFGPGYHSGKFPYGRWPVTAYYVDGDWSSHQNPNDDVAFLKVGKPIEPTTGAEHFVADRQPPMKVTVVGYPDATARPISCTNTARRFHHPGPLTQLVFDCDGYTDGTSGGPFLRNVNPKTGDGQVVGLIGGYEQGGDSPNVSYSPQFGTNIRNLFTHAKAAA
jgi:V8-like Glu-specific endopeptidase